MENRFEDILIELGKELDMPLHPDSLGACTLTIDNVLDVQMEPDSTLNRIAITLSISELNPGKFRENVLLNALKANNKPFPRLGNFAYSEKRNQLILFIYIPFKDLHGEDLAAILSKLIEKARLWKDAIDAGNAAPTEVEEQKGSPLPNPFGMKP